jgi:hypothetical protein
LTSCATTAKPRPVSPARFASIAALSASRLVCRAIAVISVATWSMSFTVVTSAAVLATALSVHRVASSTMLEAFATCAPM